jgi:hypothetical protein
MRGLLAALIGAVPIAASIASGCGSDTGTGLFSGDGGGSDASNPPGCPAGVPPSGQPCSLSKGTTCTYGACGATFAACDGTWAIGTTNVVCNPPDARSDAPPPADGPFACGRQTCSATAYCVYPCCGGVAPPCEEKPEGGTCPAGTHDEFCAPIQTGVPGQNCRADPCTPPPPYCTDDASALPYGCTVGGTHDVSCVCA